MECPVFCPTLAEVQGLTWEQYIENIEDCIAGPGLCKIVMPEGWTPRQADYNADTLDFPIGASIVALVDGQELQLLATLTVCIERQSASDRFAQTAVIAPTNRRPWGSPCSSNSCGK